MSLNSFKYIEGGNFRIKVVSNNAPVSNVSGTLLNNGVTTAFFTDEGGMSQLFSINESNPNIIITIPPFDGFNNTIVNHILDLQNQFLEIALTVNVNVTFRLLRGQPIRFVNQNGGKGVDNRLLCNMTLGGEALIKGGDYQIKRLINKDEYISINCSTITNVIKVFNADTGIQIGLDIAMDNISNDLYQAVFNWQDLNIPLGNYYLKIVLGGSQELISEPILLLGDLGYYGLVEYTNTNDRDGLVFSLDPKPQYYIVSPFDLISTDDDSEVDIFVNDVNNATILYDEVKDLYSLKTFREIPFYEKKTLQIALGYDEVKVNGDFFIKLDQGGLELFEELSHMMNYTTTLQLKEFESQNFN